MKSTKSKSAKAAANETPQENPPSEGSPTTLTLPIRKEFDVYMEQLENKKGVHRLSKESISPFATDINRVKRIESKFYVKNMRKANQALRKWEDDGANGSPPKVKEIQKAELYRAAINIGLDVLEELLEKDIPFPSEPKNIGLRPK